MRVGVNYPWFDYGWDFGLGPAEWRGIRSTPRWYDDIDRHLDRFRAIGLTVVRWFILADGLTYGTAAEAPRLDATSASGWSFDPPPLAQDTLDHFDELLRRFADAGRAFPGPIQLLPVLIDFYFCAPGTTPVVGSDPGDPRTANPDPGWIKGGRADAIIDAAKRRRFLDEVLDPLLIVSERYPDAIYAWELMNEPDLITGGWRSGASALHSIDQHAMTAFLEEGKEHIRRAGFKSTVGFASFTGLRRSGITADINQFHHYAGGRRPLRRHTFDPRHPGIIGEFATAPTDVWPELVTSGQSVLNRLKLADARGYPLAMPWSFLASDRHTLWSAAVEREVEAFTREQEVDPT
jgi:hypothetical protein